MDKLIILFVVLAILIVLIWLVLRGKKQIVYKMIYALVNEAEEIYGSKTGKLKFAYVVEKIYTMLPAFFKVFITYNTLEKWIEKALVEAKEFWAEQAGINEDLVKVTGFAQDN